METLETFGIWDIIINGVLASGLIGTIIFFKAKKRQKNAEASGAEIDNSERIIKMQADHIGRMENRMERIEIKVERLELGIERKQIIIQQAYKCQIPATDCPVLRKREELGTKIQCYDKGLQE